MKTDSIQNKFKNYSIDNLSAIIGGTATESGDGGDTDKKKLQIPTQGDTDESDSN